MKDPHDPKTTYFKDIIQKKLKNEPERKIVVFTEFADTADYLYKSLKDDIRVFKYSAEDSSEKINRLSGRILMLVVISKKMITMYLLLLMLFQRDLIYIGLGQFLIMIFRIILRELFNELGALTV